jgi:hypothetical protein
MSGEFAWWYGGGYCDDALQRVAEAMREEATQATSILAADFVERVGTGLLHLIAYSEASDAIIDERNMPEVEQELDKLIAVLREMKQRIPELVNQGNGAELLRDTD